jgi:hypothetical protein
VPLKPAHTEYLYRVLLPLVKMPAFVLYHSPLLYCLLQFTIKVIGIFFPSNIFTRKQDPTLTLPIVKYLFSHWPVQTSRKQVLVLGCVEMLVSLLSLSFLFAFVFGCFRWRNLTTASWDVLGRQFCPTLRAFCATRTFRFFVVCCGCCMNDGCKRLEIGRWRCCRVCA